MKGLVILGALLVGCSAVGVGRGTFPFQDLCDGCLRAAGRAVADGGLT